MHIVPFNSHNNPTEIGALTLFTDIKTEARQSGMTCLRYARQGVDWDPDVPKYGAELTFRMCISFTSKGSCKGRERESP